jgi:hypothetical protein
VVRSNAEFTSDVTEYSRHLGGSLNGGSPHLQVCSYTGQQKIYNDSKAHSAQVEIQINSSAEAAVQDSKGLTEWRV